MLSEIRVIFYRTSAILMLIHISAAAQPTDKNNSEDTKDFSAVEAYFFLADRLREKKEPTDIEWQRYFKSPINSMMISSAVIDVDKFKDNLRKVYSNNESDFHKSDPELAHHVKYKISENELKKHILFLKSSHVTDSILKYLCPFVPPRLCPRQHIPKQFYTFYGSSEATGAPGMVVCDLYLSFLADSYRLGLISAHETFHSIVTSAFLEIIKIPVANIDNDSNIDLLFFLSNVSQEGVADLIDKPLLSKTESPLKLEVDRLMADELQLAVKCITKIDSLLENANGALTMDFNTLNSRFCYNGAHIPGRLMGKVIRDSGLLSQLLPVIEDPVLFFELYNKAVIKSNQDLPVFSKRTMKYLHDLRLNYYKAVENNK